MKIKTNLSATRPSRTLNKRKVIWGFMLENTLFTEFQEENHAKIEAAYSQRKQRSTSYYIEVEDSNLPRPYKARVYFGVARMHLRMPGTRYYVERHVITPPLLSPCSATSLTGSYESCSSPFPMTPAFMPSPMSTASTTTSITTNSSNSCSSYSDLLCPPLDPTLAALFSEDLMLPIPNGAISGQNTSMGQQFFTPIGNQNVRSGDMAASFGNSLAPGGAFNCNQNWNQINNGSQGYSNFGSGNMVSSSKDLNMASSLNHKMPYVGNTQHKKQHQQSNAPLNSMLAHDFTGSLPTNANELLQVINWLNDDALCTPTSTSNSSNNGSISFQELVSWPPFGPSLVPKLNNSCDDGNINMTNLYHDLNHFNF
ncbi:hypothetical protein V8B55DRAFT_1569021 [Mucor lusitanicus]|uniref:Uncharacterized protein n=2 Tax=Mucor circinelloides f. lusitanicus TaxID=29924 RepID=A0A168JXZ4_MUCCL|nr:hypothetical protein FB192DRAFT_1463806 [Mucor lusitanicus]OAD01752.1 hypothetical protein MUCCIDRAFT_163713 [Mucor lusitanicus CBS 277.49]